MGSWGLETGPLGPDGNTHSSSWCVGSLPLSVVALKHTPLTRARRRHAPPGLCVSLLKEHAEHYVQQFHRMDPMIYCTCQPEKDE